MPQVPAVVLPRTKTQEHETKEHVLRTSFSVLEDYWHAKGGEVASKSGMERIYELIPKEAFLEVPFEEIDKKNIAGVNKLRYGVLTYTWSDMPWKDILDKLEEERAGRSDVDWFWIDIFCVDQTLPAEEKMRTIKQTVPIYQNASEHHILGLRTLQRGWCLCEISARKKKPEIVKFHTQFKTPTTQDVERAAIDKYRAAADTAAAISFENCEFSKNTDRPLVEKVVFDSNLLPGPMPSQPRRPCV